MKNLSLYIHAHIGMNLRGCVELNPIHCNILMRDR